ncbi:hypothetical protein DL93DRAFT_1370773 [Clavulina sp. PMI_390]|nr:hypothetical protein DL93DRAFT_1370773 [Clavulina sp. PMI_390]
MKIPAVKHLFSAEMYARHRNGLPWRFRPSCMNHAPCWIFEGICDFSFYRSVQVVRRQRQADNCEEYYPVVLSKKPLHPWIPACKSPFSLIQPFILSISLVPALLQRSSLTSTRSRFVSTHRRSFAHAIHTHAPCLAPSAGGSILCQFVRCSLVLQVRDLTLYCRRVERLQSRQVNCCC